MAVELRTERLWLRQWREEDREAFRAMNADARVMEFMPKMLTAKESDALVDRMARHFEEHGFGGFAVEVQECGRFAGFIGLAIPRFEAAFMPAVEIGWRLGVDLWGRGLATEGAKEVVRFAFEDVGLKDLVSFTALGNRGSRRVMEKLGMTHDPLEDFEHPRIEEGHPLRHHVLYRLRREDWAEAH